MENAMIRDDISIWLIPAEPRRAVYQDTINNLAAEYGSVPFTPHVTVYAGSGDSEAVIRAAAVVATSRDPLTLYPKKLQVSSEFTKTLYIHFSYSEELNILFSEFANRNLLTSEYVLSPHLSLLYQSLSPDVLSRLRNAVPFDINTVLFDELHVVRTPSPVTAVEDVKRWQLLHTEKLG